MSDNVHGTCLDFERKIYDYVGIGVPTTTCPVVASGCRYLDAGTGIWYSMVGSTWTAVGSGGGAPAWSSITGKPTTRDGYGITDVYTMAQSDARYLLLTGGTLSGSLTVAGAQISLTANAAEVNTSFGGVTTSRFFTDASGGAISVDGGNSFSIKTGGKTGTAQVVVSPTTVSLTGALTIGANFTGTRIGIQDNLVCEVYSTGIGNLAFNYYGYNFGFTQFRDFSVYDGKGANILYITGTNKSAIFAGTVSFGSWIGLTVASGAPTGYLTAAQAANSTITGSAAGDICIRGNGKRILFSTDSGTTLETALTGGGRLYTLGSVNSEGHGRFKGWYSAGVDSVGPAAEIGYSSGTAYVLGYNRSTTSYVPLSIQGSSLGIVCDTSITGALSVSGIATMSGRPMATYNVASVAPTGSDTAPDGCFWAVV